MVLHNNPDFIHHQKDVNTSLIREGIFGMEDGMVSTMGAITGIAVGTGNHFTALLSGFVIIAVESISMAVGSYLSSKSEKEIDERKLAEEKIELREHPKEEKEELVHMYIKDGWPQDLAEQMATVASKNKELFLQEMAYRELKIIPEGMESPGKNGLVMWISYILGGSLPIIPYIIFTDLSYAIPVSVTFTLLCLFILGAATTKYSKRAWWRAGFEMVGLAGLAAAIGYGVGEVADVFLSRK